MNRFQRDTAVEARAPGQFAARIDRAWWIVRGPNGGYVAAILLRAMMAELADAARTPRSLTVHFTSPPVEGPVTIDVTCERAGRSLTTLQARMLQDGKLRALAIGAFSLGRSGPVFAHAPMPEVAPPEACPSIGDESVVALRGQFDSRLAVGPGPGETSPAATTGGWMRLREEPHLDFPLLAALTDAWPPAVFSLGRDGFLAGVPTVDLTVHFRSPLPEGEDPTAHVLGVFRSRHADDGFVEEDGEIWSRGGVLLAQSRQLGVVGTPR